MCVLYTHTLDCAYHTCAKLQYSISNCFIYMYIRIFHMCLGYIYRYMYIYNVYIPYILHCIYYVIIYYVCKHVCTL